MSEQLYCHEMKPGDWVVGHTAYYQPPNGRALVPGKIVAVRSPGKVVFEIDTLLMILGLPRRSTWTYRRSRDRWFQKGTNGKSDEGGLFMVSSAKPARRATA